MSDNNFFKHTYIKICRHLFGKKYLRVMAGPLKGYLWSTAGSYEYIMGNYEDPELMKAFLSWLKTDSIFYDIGSNIGFHALTANRFIQSGKIYAFEPMPLVRRVFEDHIRLNSRLIRNNNISILPFAITDQEKQVEFSNNLDQSDGNTYIKESPVFSGAKNKMTIQGYSVDGLLKQGYERPDIIKIDAEGAEYDILQGAVNSLQQYKPYILLATHDWHLPGIKDKCVNFLQGLGYRLQHTGDHNKQLKGLDDYIAIHESRL